ncbi:helix-hairpin-helix domain-containing protein [Shigella flexneri]
MLASRTTSARHNWRVSWSAVVESCVNAVGVDLNTAYRSAVDHVAGLTRMMAQNISLARSRTVSSRTVSNCWKVRLAKSL